MAKYEVQFEESKSPFAESTKKEKEEAREIIEKAPTCIDKDSKPKTLVKGKLVRLDLQGQFNRDGVRYANLQIQLNKQRPRMEEAEGEAAEVELEAAELGGPKKSTTIALVLMPSDEDIPRAILEKAYNGSMDKKQKAVIVKK